MGIKLNRYFHDCWYCGNPFRTISKFGKTCPDCAKKNINEGHLKLKQLYEERKVKTPTPSSLMEKHS